MPLPDRSASAIQNTKWRNQHGPIPKRPACSALAACHAIFDTILIIFAHDEDMKTQPLQSLPIISDSSFQDSALQLAAHSSLSSGILFSDAPMSSAPAFVECFYWPDFLHCASRAYCHFHLHCRSHPIHASSSSPRCRQALQHLQSSRRPCPLVHCTRLRSSVWPVDGFPRHRGGSRTGKQRTRL